VKADDAATSDAQLTMEKSESSYNGNGLTAGSNSIVSVGESKISFNSSCSFNISGGSLVTFTLNGGGTNRIIGPTCGGTPNPLPQQ